MTPSGTPIEVNEHLFEADIVIGTGAVVPHHIAGFSAGAKIVQPGVSGAATTAATHMFSARARTPLLGRIDTPVRAEMELIAERCGMTHVLNVTLNADGQIVTAHFGATRPTYRRAVADARRIYGVRTPAGLDAVVAGSHPCDIEFWQAHKSLYPAMLMVRPGGTIIVVTPCPEGVAVTHPEILEYTAQPAERCCAATSATRSATVWPPRLPWLGPEFAITRASCWCPMALRRTKRRRLASIRRGRGNPRLRSRTKKMAQRLGLGILTHATGHAASGGLSGGALGRHRDDLTGALDTALQFRKAGQQAFVSTRSGVWPADGRVVAMSTETRHTSAETAAAQVQAAFRALRPGTQRRLYKKTDSLLRGNVGAELRVLRHAAGADPIVFAPAFPAGGRTTMAHP